MWQKMAVSKKVVLAARIVWSAQSFGFSEVRPDLSGNALFGPELKVPLSTALALRSGKQPLPRWVDVHCSPPCKRSSLPLKVPVNPWFFLLVLCGDVEANPGPVRQYLSLCGKMKTKKLRIVHLNARSLICHLDELALLAASQRPDVLAVSETWLDSGISDGEISIPGYSVTRLDWNCCGSGIAVFCANYLKCSTLSQDISASGLESLWVAVESGLFPSLLALGCFYRPPGSLTQFMMSAAVLRQCRLPRSML